MLPGRIARLWVDRAVDAALRADRVQSLTGTTENRFYAVSCLGIVTPQRVHEAAADPGS